MSAEAPEINGLIETHGRLLQDAGIMPDYVMALEVIRQNESEWFESRELNFSDHETDYQIALSGEHRPIVLSLHFPEPGPGEPETTYFITQTMPDGTELVAAAVPMVDRLEDGSVVPIDQGAYTVDQSQAELIARLGTELEASGWQPK